MMFKSIYHNLKSIPIFVICEIVYRNKFPYLDIILLELYNQQLISQIERNDLLVIKLQMSKI